MRHLSVPLRQWPAAAVRASRTEGGRRAVTAMGIALAAGLFLAVGGAFGTDGLPTGRRLVYWLVTMSVTTAIAMGVSRPIYDAPWGGDRIWLKGAVSTLLIAVVLTPVVWLLSVAPFRLQGGTLPLPGLFGSVLAIAAVMTALNILAERRQAGAKGVPAPRFHERLPHRLRGAEVHAVQAEDHYLRLHTSKGSDLILLRLSDAMAELEGLEGAQTHRSWWVARDAVQDVRKNDGRATLTLKGGVEAPVSRTFAKAWRERGWI